MGRARGEDVSNSVGHSKGLRCRVCTVNCQTVVNKNIVAT